MRKTRSSCIRKKAAAITGFVACASLSSPSYAYTFDTENRDLAVSWNNTVKYSAAWRLKDQSSVLTEGPNATNEDDGDRNFDKGMISNRFDLLSEVDARYKDVSLRISGAAWYDEMYRTRTDHDNPESWNAISQPFGKLPEEVREQHGKDAELLDAFISLRGFIGDKRGSVRIGQHAQQWGETLFYGVNGIAGAMAPVDVVKALSVPNSQFKEIIRPVNQVSGALQLTQAWSLGAFYQFEWEESRLPGSGSYFSGADFFGPGSETIFLPPGAVPIPGAYFESQGNVDAKNSGQGGLQATYWGNAVNLGFYALQFHDKTPKPHISAGRNSDPASGKVGEYFFVYPEDIRTIGFSASTSTGAYNFGFETSMRWNMPLNVYQVEIAPDAVINQSDNPAYATGKTLHANLNWMASYSPNFLAKESMFMGEVAWNRLISVDDNPETIDPDATKDALAIQLLYTPTYRQVLAGVDLSIPVGVTYSPMGKSSVLTNFAVHEGGNFNIGMNGVYKESINFGLTYTHYFGASYTGLDLSENNQFSYKQSLKDRDFISFSVSTTF